MKLVSRREWGARAPRAQASYLSSTRGVKVHYTGSRVDPRLKDDHGRCAALVRQIQNGHMDGNGWNDIGYSFVVCPHAYVYEGRGLHRLPAANGPGLNSGHYAVLGMVGNSGLVDPTDAMLNGIRDAIDHVRDKGTAGREIKGHKDGYATSCPGPKLYAWVKDGAPRPDGPEPPPPEGGDELEIVLSLGTKEPLTIGPGARESVDWGVEFADPSDVHSAGSAWFPKTSDWHLVGLSAVVNGQLAGEKLKLIISQYEQAGVERIKDELAEDKVGNGTPIEYALTGIVWMGKERSYRVDLLNLGTQPVTLEKASFKIAR